MSLLATILLGAAAVAGVLFIPGLAYVIGPGLNYLRVGRPLASLLLALAVLPIPDAVLYENADGELSIVRGATCDNDGPTFALGFVNVRLGADVSEAAYDKYVAETDIDALDASHDTSYVEHGPVRKGIGSFVHTRTDGGKLLVRAGEALRRFGLAHGADVGVEAGQRAEEKYTGDTGQHSEMVHIVVSLLMFFSAVSIGWVVFW